MASQAFDVVPAHKATQYARGGCLCGSVKYRITGVLREVIYCHCEQCRRTSGHFVAATACLKDDLHFDADTGLQWFPSSDEAERGFCVTCGSSLFWRKKTRDAISVMAGTLDVPTHLTAKRHIYVADASDYYALNDGLPQTPNDVEYDSSTLVGDLR